MYSDVFCKVYNEFGWNYYPDAFADQLLDWLKFQGVHPENCLDLGCGTGILCQKLADAGIRARGMDFSSGMIAIARSSRPDIPYEVGDMIVYRPQEDMALVTSTGDVLNHIGSLADVGKIFRNVFSYLTPGGWFVFDILNENEVSDSEPFEMDFSETVRVWFRMTRPEENRVNLKIRVYENGSLSFEENIRETLHAPEKVLALLAEAGFEEIRCADRLLPAHNPGSTWFVTARKPEE